MPGRLTDKVALITGSSSGLGSAIAHAYAAEGAHICCVDLYPSPRNPVDPATGKADSFHNRVAGGTPTHEALRAAHGGRHVFVRADVTAAGDVEAAVAACVRAFGRLDVMVNNAGISVESAHVRPRRVHETDEDEYDRTMAVNAKGVFLGCKYAVRQMLRQQPLPGVGGDRGWIVNTASVQGFLAYFGTRTSTTASGGRGWVQLAPLMRCE